MQKPIKPIIAMTLSLGELKQPVVTNYQLNLLIFKLYALKKFRDRNIAQLKKNFPDPADCNRYVRDLEKAGIINENSNFSQRSVFNIIGKDLSSAEEIICTVDPFSYLSHLSAMAYHGLTDRLPKVIFLSSPQQVEWRNVAKQRMGKDLGDYASNYYNHGLQKLTRINFNKVNKTIVYRYSSGYYSTTFKSVKDKMLRVASLGRTFLDMIRRPDLCGGIHHVLSVYEAHASDYYNLIQNEVNLHGTKIDKVRTGYILEELCRLKNDTIDEWQKYVQRGGSRKLDPNGEYSSEYSERWSLSLNI